MPDEEEPKIIADDDWKAEAQREKERLAAEAEQTEGAGEEGESSPFLDLLDILAQQVVLSMGGAQLPNGQTLPANPAAAKHFIDMLAMLQEKTQGNLTKEEEEVLSSLVSRLRWAFSMAASGQGGAAPGAGAPDGAAPPGDVPPPQPGQS